MTRDQSPRQRVSAVAAHRNLPMFSDLASSICRKPDQPHFFRPPIFPHTPHTYAHVEAALSSKPNTRLGFRACSTLCHLTYAVAEEIASGPLELTLQSYLTSYRLAINDTDVFKSRPCSSPKRKPSLRGIQSRLDGITARLRIPEQHLRVWLLEKRIRDVSIAT